MEENQKSYYAIIPANVRYDKELQMGARMLYGEITALCNEKGYCWANNNYFAELYGVSKTTISIWINKLIEKGYLYSEITYKKDSKEVLSRHLKIISTPIQENLHTPIQEILYTPIRNLIYPIQENLKDNNTINNTINNMSDDFEKIWEIYPKKENKNTAFKHYKAWLKGKQYAGKTVKLTNKQMWFAVSRYADECVESKREKQYIKMGSTFFNEAIMEYVKDDS